MNNPPTLNDAQKQALLQEASRRLGTPVDRISAALEAGDTAALTSRLTPENAARLQSLLSDNRAMQALLEKPELQALLRSWDKGGTTGG